MKRRSFGAIAAGGIAALKAGPACAQAAQDPSPLGKRLTPIGAEMAGNAAGTIPAWTGGLTALPAGLQANDYVPELFPGEQPVVTIDASNMSKYADNLSDGVMAMMTKYGYKINVFPTHRTAAQPHYVYANAATNCATAKFTPKDPVGGRFGFMDAFGAAPFPIPDATNPLTAGAQIIWNHNTRWQGYTWYITNESYVMSNGQLSLAYKSPAVYEEPYYDPNGSIATFTSNHLEFTKGPYSAPANLVGQCTMIYYSTNPYALPTQAWQLLNGEGRVRRAPEVSFDTPSTDAAGICNYDEYYGFNGSLEKYDWKFLGKREMYIPYNNNGLLAGPAQQAMQLHFLDPALVRWELHRCWVVDATVHAGERNVLARRRLYIDEDTWTAAYVDAWDENGNLIKVNLMFNYCRPDLPGVVPGANSINNLQTDDYALLTGCWNQKVHSTLRFVASLPVSTFDPQAMAASAQY